MRNASAPAAVTRRSEPRAEDLAPLDRNRRSERTAGRSCSSSRPRPNWRGWRTAARGRSPRKAKTQRRQGRSKNAAAAKPKPVDPEKIKAGYQKAIELAPQGRRADGARGQVAQTEGPDRRPIRRPRRRGRSSRRSRRPSRPRKTRSRTRRIRTRKRRAAETGSERQEERATEAGSERPGQEKRRSGEGRAAEEGRGEEESKTSKASPTSRRRSRQQKQRKLSQRSDRGGVAEGPRAAARKA